MEAAKQNSQGLTEEADLEGQRLVMVGICADIGYGIKWNKISMAIIFFSAALTKSGSLHDSRTRPASKPSQVYTAGVLFLL